MSGINRQPYGLLSFFGIKNTGRNPASMGEVLSPTLPLDEWYLALNSEPFTVNISVPVIGFTGFVQVPQFETWAILGCTVNSTAVLGAGTTLQVQGAWARSSPAGQVVAPLTGLGTRSTTGQVATAFGEPQGYTLIPPGANIGVYCSEVVAGPVTCTLNLQRVVMQL